MILDDVKEWKGVTGWEDYEMSDTGLVRVKEDSIRSQAGRISMPLIRSGINIGYCVSRVVESGKKKTQITLSTMYKQLFGRELEVRQEWLDETKEYVKIQDKIKHPGGPNPETSTKKEWKWMDFDPWLTYRPVWANGIVTQTQLYPMG